MCCALFPIIIFGIIYPSFWVQLLIILFCVLLYALFIIYDTRIIC
jgi:hypothetical protein